jgi:hypothetical protein
MIKLSTGCDKGYQQLSHRPESVENKNFIEIKNSNSLYTRLSEVIFFHPRVNLKSRLIHEINRSFLSIANA